MKPTLASTNIINADSSHLVLFPKMSFRRNRKTGNEPDANQYPAYSQRLQNIYGMVILKESAEAIFGELEGESGKEYFIPYTIP